MMATKSNPQRCSRPRAAANGGMYMLGITITFAYTKTERVIAQNRYDLARVAHVVLSVVETSAGVSSITSILGRFRYASIVDKAITPNPTPYSVNEAQAKHSQLRSWSSCSCNCLGVPE